MKGTRAQHSLWGRLFDGSGTKAFRARKGVTTDANGIYFVNVRKAGSDTLIRVSNDPSLGKRRVPKVSVQIEKEHVFPLLRGSGVAAFDALIDPHSCIIVPQWGMHGDERLAQVAPKTFRYFKRFEETLKARSSYRRFQSTQKFWSTWSTGRYTFSPYKVVWQEIGGGQFAAAYVGSVSHPVLGRKVVVPDHKVYFVPCMSAAEAAYLTGFLNSPSVADGINAYAAVLSLGTSVVEYLSIPPFRRTDDDHMALVELSRKLTRSRAAPTDKEWCELDRLATRIHAASVG